MKLSRGIAGIPYSSGCLSGHVKSSDTNTQSSSGFTGWGSSNSGSGGEYQTRSGSGSRHYKVRCGKNNVEFSWSGDFYDAHH